ncbi:MAG: hypothetical protein IPK31_12930 [Chitinophagaceae bacterium]|nr:hypothetical protein [Chitinophagaceae bacterium]
MPRISILIPVLNEAENILPLFYEVKKFIPEDFEVILLMMEATILPFLKYSSYQKETKG